MSNNPYFKNNSFTKTPGVAQMASYAVFLLQTVLFYAVILPHLETLSTRVTLGILYTTSLFLMIAFSLSSSLDDPSDTAMIMYRNNRENFQSWRQTYEGRLLYCDHCLSYVKEKSRHCRACDRCVQNFDHHCMWINNCVGETNYRSFFYMILSAFFHLLLYVISLGVFTSQNNFRSYLEAFIISWISGGINGVFVFLLLNLIILHIYLISKGISTYEFIVAQREEQRKRKQQQQQKKRGSQSQKVVFPAETVIKKSPIEQETNGQFFERKRLDRKMKQNGDEHNETQQPNLIRVESKSTVHKQKNQHIIFGEKELTQKSSGKLEKQYYNENQPSGQSQTSSMQLSQLLVRNKSLKLIIGQNNYYKPHSISRQQTRVKVHSTFK